MPALPASRQVGLASAPYLERRPRPRSAAARDPYALLTIVTIAWGALAFGAVYPWAYWPIAIAAAVLGAWGWMSRPARPVARPLLIALVVVLVAAAIQLVPVPAATLHAISPAADRFLRQYDVAYALAVTLTPDAHHALSIAPARTMVGLALAAALALLLTGLLRRQSALSVDRVARGIAIVGVLLAVVGIVQSATFNGKLYGFWQPNARTYEPFGPFVNRNHFAGWMLLALPLTIGNFCGHAARAMRDVRPDWRSRLLWFSTPDASRVVLLGAATIVMTLALVMTMSRAGVLCFAVAMVATLPLMHDQRLSVRKRIVILLYLALLGAVLTWLAMDGVAARFFAEGMLGVRLGAWQDAVAIARRFWLAGTGLDTYGVATVLYQQHLLAYHFAEAHNDYLQVAVEGGLLVGIPAACLLATFILSLRRALRRPCTDVVADWTRRGAIGALAAIALQETVDFSLQMPGNAFLFVIVSAIALYGDRVQPTR